MPSVLSISFCLWLIYRLFKPHRNNPDQQYWNGPKPTEKESANAKAGIIDHLEKFPNGILANRNPEYMQEFLGSIDLDLPPGIHLQ